MSFAFYSGNTTRQTRDCARRPVLGSVFFLFHGRHRQTVGPAVNATPKSPKKKYDEYAFRTSGKPEQLYVAIERLQQPSEAFVYG